jgi:hypothetical protein
MNRPAEPVVVSGVLFRFEVCSSLVGVLACGSAGSTAVSAAGFRMLQPQPDRLFATQILRLRIAGIFSWFYGKAVRPDSVSILIEMKAFVGI